MSQIGSPIGGPTRIGNCMVGKKANPKTQVWLIIQAVAP
jgi:hypothetical protein